MPSHALPPGQESGTRRRAGRRRLRDWRTWGPGPAVVAALLLSDAITGHLWPRAHGVGYLVTHVIVSGVLAGAIVAVVVVVAIVLAGIVRDRRLQQ